MSRSTVPWIVVAALVAFVLGAAGMYYLSGIVSTYGTGARFIADAAVDTEVLERLSGGRADEAKRIVETRLRGSMHALTIVEEDLSKEQRAVYEALVPRVRALLPEQASGQSDR